MGPVFWQLCPLHFIIDFGHFRLGNDYTARNKALGISFIKEFNYFDKLHLCALMLLEVVQSEHFGHGSEVIGFD